MDFRKYLDNQIKNKKINWESRSALIRAAGQSVNGHTNRILKNYENNFNFGTILEIKNKEIKKYFSNQPKDSFISVVGAVKIINESLPKDMQISETIIYNRLDDPKFNTNNLKGQTLNNQVSKTAPYDVKISKDFEEQLKKIRKPGIYLYLEKTQRGGSTLRLKTNEDYGNLDKSFPPNEDSLKEIKKLINEQKK
tara:strand:- start:92 stop:676 length:585 start_codon:yes stop_codon:yes gene_type:complete